MITMVAMASSRLKATVLMRIPVGGDRYWVTVPEREVAPETSWRGENCNRCIRSGLMK